MLEIHFAIRVLNIKVAVISENLLGRHFPGSFVFLPLVPPCDAISKLFELQGFRLGVIVTTFWQWLFIVPDLASARFFALESTCLEEDQVGGDAGIRCKDTVGQAYNSVQIEACEQ